MNKDYKEGLQTQAGVGKGICLRICPKLDFATRLVVGVLLVALVDIDPPCLLVGDRSDVALPPAGLSSTGLSN